MPFVVPPSGSSGWASGDHTAVDEWPWSDADNCFLQVTNGNTGSGVLHFDLSDLTAPPTGVRLAVRHRVHAAGHTWDVDVTLQEGAVDVVTLSPTLTLTAEDYVTHLFDFDDAALTGVSSLADLRVRFDATNNSGANSRYYVAGAVLGANPLATAKTTLGGTPVEGWWSSRNLVDAGYAVNDLPVWLPDWTGRGQFLMGLDPATLVSTDPDVSPALDPASAALLEADSTVYTTALTTRLSGNFGVVAAVRPVTDVVSDSAVVMSDGATDLDFAGSAGLTDKNILVLDGSRGDGITIMSGDGSGAAHLHGGVVPYDQWQVWAEQVESADNEKGFILVTGSETFATVGDTGLVIDAASGSNDLFAVSWLNRESRDRPFIDLASDLVLLDLSGFATEAEREQAVTDAAHALGVELGLWAGDGDGVSGGSATVVTVSVSGDGSKQVSGGDATAVAVSAAGGGAKTAEGGSSVSVAAQVIGDGQKAASGGSTATVTATVAGGGRRGASGGSDAATAITATGNGTKATEGGADATVTVAVTGGGTAATDGAGGSTSVVTVTTAGAGAKHGSGGSAVTVSTTTTGAGEKAADGGSDAAVAVVALGGGTAAEGPSGGSNVIVEVLSTGAGQKHTSGGSDAAVAVAAVGAGVSVGGTLPRYQGPSITATTTSPGAGGAFVGVSITADRKEPNVS